LSPQVGALQANKANQLKTKKLLKPFLHQ